MKAIVKTLLIAAAALSVTACFKSNPDDNVYSATVTFRPTGDGKYYLKCDEDLAMIVLNDDMQKYPYNSDPEKRALIQYTESTGSKRTDKVPGFKETIYVNLMSIDTVTTRKPVVFDPTKEYGNALVGMFLEGNTFPKTMIEDGYLNVLFMVTKNPSLPPHDFTLVTGVDPNDPYTVEFRHDNKGDKDDITTYTYFMNFPLKDLPDTKGQNVKLTLRWKSLATGQMESIKFDYRSRTDWPENL